MRVASLIAKTLDGKWVALAQGNDVAGYKNQIKKMKSANGDGKYIIAKLLISGGAMKTAKFKAEAKKPVTAPMPNSKKARRN